MHKNVKMLGPSKKHLMLKPDEQEYNSVKVKAEIWNNGELGLTVYTDQDDPNIIRDPRALDRITIVEPSEEETAHFMANIQKFTQKQIDEILSTTPAKKSWAPAPIQPEKQNFLCGVKTKKTKPFTPTLCPIPEKKPLTSFEMQKEEKAVIPTEFKEFIDAGVLTLEEYLLQSNSSFYNKVGRSLLTPEKKQAKKYKGKKGNEEKHSSDLSDHEKAEKIPLITHLIKRIKLATTYEYVSEDVEHTIYAGLYDKRGHVPGHLVTACIEIISSHLNEARQKILKAATQLSEEKPGGASSHGIFSAPGKSKHTASEAYESKQHRPG